MMMIIIMIIIMVMIIIIIIIMIIHSDGYCAPAPPNSNCQEAN